MVRRTAQVELTIEDLDKELIARGAQIPSGELFKFEDTEGTPAREDMMEGVKELHEAASATSPNPALSSIDTWDLYRLIIHKTRQREENRKRGIWFEDNRMDFCGITDRKVQENVNCVAAIILKGDLSEKRNGKSTLKVKNYGKAFNMCETEPFRDQYVAAGRVCTGFLVKKNVIATAAHCVLGYDVRDLYFVFGFKMLDSTTPVTEISNNNIYRGKKIIGCTYRKKVNPSDWALVKLDREVEGQEVVRLSKDEIKRGQKVYVMGHPLGLPLKYAPGAQVRGFNQNFFSADLDIYMGSSGSPVFNHKTHEVIGIVVHGDKRDLRWTGKGWASIIYTSRDINAKGPQCCRVSEFFDIVNVL